MRTIMLALLLFAAASLEAQIPRPQVFVDAVNGSNVTGNGTSQAPYQTITQALAQITPPVTINVAAGTYDMALGEVFPLAIGPGIDVIGAGGMSSVIMGTGIGQQTLVLFQGLGFSAPDGISHMGLTNANIGLKVGLVGSAGQVLVDTCRVADHRMAGITITSGECTVKNSMITSNKQAGMSIGGPASPLVRLIDNDVSGNRNWGVTIAPSGRLQVMIGNTISSNGTGICVRGFAATGSRIERNIITNNTDIGLLVTLPFNVPPPDVLIAGNLIANNGTDGIRVNSNNHPISVLNNTIVNNGGCGFIVSTFGSGSPPPILVQLLNNIITGNTVCSTGLWSPLLVIVGHCVGSHNMVDVPGYCGNGSPISGPPQFVDPMNGDYHLLPSSPAVDASTLFQHGIPLFDLDGNIRSFDGDGDGDPLPDLGAFEVVPVNTTGLRPLGHGCADPLGRPLLAGSGGFPIPGNMTFGLQITGAPMNTQGWLQMATALGPLDLGPQNCAVWIDPQSFVFPGLGLPIFLDAAGSALIPLPIPPLPSLSGLTAFFQVVALVPPGQPFAVLSNALEVVVQ